MQFVKTQSNLNTQTGHTNSYIQCDLHLLEISIFLMFIADKHSEIAGKKDTPYDFRSCLIAMTFLSFHQY